MATYGVRGSEYDSARFREWERQIRGRDFGNDIRVVRIRAAYYRDHWVAGHDPEYTAAGPLDR